MRLLKRTLMIAVAVYLGFGAYLFAFQRSLMYFPSRPVSAAQHLDAVQVANDGATVNVWRANPGKAPALIYFGGNAEAAARVADDLAALAPGRSIYLVDYRGYGASSGEPSEDALYGDALAVYDRVAEAHGPIAVVGRSLGTGVATYLAVNRDVERLVLVTPYDSVTRLAGALYPFYPVSLMLRDRFDSLSRAPGLRQPTLFLLAGRDRVVPPEHGMRLAEAMDPQWVTLRVLEEASHYDITARGAYREALGAFLSPTGRDAGQAAP
jgi:pimeloyl-ACP methyl ester carboxylesterase